MIFSPDAPHAALITRLVLDFLDDRAIAAYARVSHYALEYVAAYYQIDARGWSGTEQREPDRRPLPNATFLTALTLVRYPHIPCVLRFSKRRAITAETLVIYYMQQSNKFTEFEAIGECMENLHRTRNSLRRLIDAHAAELLFKTDVGDLVDAWWCGGSRASVFRTMYGGFELEQYARGATSLTVPKILVSRRQVRNLQFLYRVDFVKSLSASDYFSLPDILNSSAAQRVRRRVNAHMNKVSSFRRPGTFFDFIPADGRREGPPLDAEQVESALVLTLEAAVRSVMPCARRIRLRGGCIQGHLHRVLRLKWRELVHGQRPMVDTMNRVALGGRFHIEDVIRATEGGQVPTLAVIARVAHRRKDCVCANYCAACARNDTCPRHEVMVLCDRHRLCGACCRTCTRA